MGLDERVTELERRVAALEGDGRAEPSGACGETAYWALETWREQLAGLGAPDGGVLYTGVASPAPGEHYEWQVGCRTDDLLDADLTSAAEALAALGSPVRLLLLREILRGRRAVAELAELDGVGTTGQVYHHLRQLSAAGWLHSAGRGRYEIPPARVIPLLTALATTR